MRGWCAVSSSGSLSLNFGLYPSPKAANGACGCCFHHGFPRKVVGIKSNNNTRKVHRAISISCCASASNSNDKVCQAEIENFVVVNFYRFVFIKDPQHEVAKHLTFLKVSLVLSCLGCLFVTLFSCSTKHFWSNFPGFEHTRPNLYKWTRD